MRPRIQNVRQTVHTGVANTRRFLDAPLKSVVFEPATPRRARIGIPLDANASERRYFSYRDFNPDVEALGFHFLRDVVVRGRGFVLVDEHLLDSESLIPVYVRHGIDTGEQTDAEPDRTRRRRVVSDPVAIVVGDSHLIYGHWLVDILPRVWLLKTALGEPIPRLRIALPQDTPTYALDILRDVFELRSDELLFFDKDKEELVVDRAVVPSMLHRDHAFHPAMNQFISYISGKFLGGGRKGSDEELIYVSRHKYRAETTSYHRTIGNEQDVVALVRQRGFRVVCPEELPWDEQVRLFSKARVIVGESGSALHNAMFSDEGAVVLCIRPVNQVQATIAALRNQVVYFFCPDDERPAGGGVEFTVDIDRLDAAIQWCMSMASLRAPMSIGRACGEACPTGSAPRHHEAAV